MPSGGKRPGAGRPKGSAKPPETKQAKVTADLRQKVLDRLSPLLNVLLDNCEKGFLSLVLVGEPREKPPKGLELTHAALHPVKDLCPHCGKPELDETVIYQGYTAPLPIADIKWIIETFVGKAPTQPPPAVDTDTKFVFPAGMDCLPTPTSAPGFVSKLPEDKKPPQAERAPKPLLGLPL